MPRISLVPLVATILHALCLPAIACTGDCNGNGSVTVNELVQGVSIALGSLPIGECSAFDRDDNKRVDIGEIIAGVNFAVSGCSATATPTPTVTRTPTRTRTSTATPTPTPSSTPNKPPAIPCFDVYRTYPSKLIFLRIGATDPNRDRLHYTAENLPAGAVLNERIGALTWTPTKNQVGPFHIPFTVTDAGAPPQSTKGALVFKVSPLDLCTQPTCYPATGCSSTLIPLTQPCCVDIPAVHVAEPAVDCPQGRVLLIGRNQFTGVGPLQNCDRLQVLNNNQTSATVRFNVEARCVNAKKLATVRARLETKKDLVFEDQQDVRLDPGKDGFVQRLAVIFAVQLGGPFFDLDGAEAHLSVTLIDADGVMVSEKLRVVLTFFPLDDLPNPRDGATPQPSCVP